jgi:cysteine desulfurase family protein (TIGR01976 family)
VNEQRFPGVVAATHAGRVLADNAAASQLPREAIDAVTRYLTHENAQKGSTYARAIRTSEIVDEARASFAELIGADAADVGFGANATSISYAFARTIAHAVRPGDRIVITESDHYANVVPWSWLQRFGAELDVIEVDAHGDFVEASIAAALEREPLLVALPWASNATGTVFDIPALAERANRAGAIVVVDGVQAAPHFPVAMPPHVDFAFFSAYKIFAPHFGAWYARPEVRERFFRADDPFISATELNWSMETGTASFEALAGWLGTVGYLRDVGAGSLANAMTRIGDYERDLARFALAQFAERAGRVVLHGAPADRDRLPVFAFNLPGEDATALSKRFDELGIETRAGDYYTPRLMRRVAHEFGNGAVRMSFAHYNTYDDLTRCFAAIDRFCAVPTT